MQKRVLASITPDGSERSFSRVSWKGMSAIKIEPAPGEDGLKEALSFYRIGHHLMEKAIPVPEIYDFDSSSGILVVQDLGSAMLFDKLLDLLEMEALSSVKRLYCKVLEVLVLMQKKGGAGFDASWCWQSGVYDARLAREKETNYFLNAFVKGYMGCQVDQKVVRELDWLVAQVSNFTCSRFFLHRDFQSRNIMISTSHPAGIAVIDFQAGRLGPLGYDAASLLNDPYIDLDFDVRKELFMTYVDLLEKAGMAEDASEVIRQWPVLSALRLMQVLGAFGFLTKKRSRPFFHAYIAPALRGLVWILADNFSHKMPYTLQFCQHLEKMRSIRQI